MFTRTFATQMVPGSSSGKKPLAEPHIIPWRRERRHLTDRETVGISIFTARANRLAANARKGRDPKQQKPKR